MRVVAEAAAAGCARCRKSCRGSCGIAFRKEALRGVAVFSVAINQRVNLRPAGGLKPLRHRHNSAFTWHG